MTPYNRDDDSEEQRLAEAIEATQQAMECADDPRQYHKAEKLLAKALELAPNEPTLVQNYVGFCVEIAGYYLEDEDNENAIHYFLCALQHAPKDPESWLDLGTAYARENMAIEALQAWERCLQCLNRKGQTYAECMKTISENVMMLAKAADQQMSIAEDKRLLKTAIAKLITVMKIESE